MANQITVNELNFREQCANAWNMLTKEQQTKYHCLIDFVEAYCKLTNEEFDYEAKCRITEFVDSKDIRSYERWSEYQKKLGNR